MRLDHLLSKEHLASPAGRPARPALPEVAKAARWPLGHLRRGRTVLAQGGDPPEPPQGGCSQVEHWLFGPYASSLWLVHPPGSALRSRRDGTPSVMVHGPSTLLGPEGTAAGGFSPIRTGSQRLLARGGRDPPVP